MDKSIVNFVFPQYVNIEVPWGMDANIQFSSQFGTITCCGILEETSSAKNKVANLQKE